MFSTTMLTGRTVRLIQTAAAGLVLLGTVAGADAQTSVDPGRAFRGVFADVEPAATAVAFSADVYQGIQRPGTFHLTAPQETFAGIAPSLTFSHHGRKTTFGASAAAIARYYTNTQDVRAMYEGGAIGLRHQFGRMAVQLTQSVELQPMLQFGAVRSYTSSALGSLDHIDLEHIGEGDGLLSSSSRVGMSVQAQRYLWIQAGYGFEHFEFRGPSAQLGLFEQVARRQEAYAGMSKRFGRNTAIRLGLRSVKGAGATGPVSRQETWVHNIDLGLDRLQSITVTRTTTLSLNGGIGMMRQESTANARAIVGTGGVGLDKRIGRRARLGFTARRDLYFIEGMADPVLTNGADARFETQFARRWVVTATAGVAKGHGMTGFGASEQMRVDYDNSHVDVRTAYKLRDAVSIYAEYLRFDQTFDRSAAQPGLFLRDERRSGLRVGIQFNVPLVGGERGVE